MDTVEKSAKTVEEAIEEALLELGIAEDEADIEILDQPSRAFLGLIGGKPARVRVSAKADSLFAASDILVREEKKTTKVSHSDAVQVARDFLQKICDAMKLKVYIEKMTTDEQVILSLRGDDLGLLIGKHGQTLDALQYLVNLAANRDSDERVRIIVDVEDYRKRRADTLTQLALRLADRVKRRGERVVLEPMNAHERKIIHMALQNDSRIVTASEGEEPFRKVVIAIKK